MLHTDKLISILFFSFCLIFCFVSIAGAEESCFIINGSKTKGSNNENLRIEKKGKLIEIERAPMQDSAYKMLWSLYSLGLVKDFPDSSFFLGEGKINRMDTAGALIHFIKYLTVPLSVLPDPGLYRLDKLINIHENELVKLNVNPESLRSDISRAQKIKNIEKLRKKKSTKFYSH
jgi:hypothetical protein